MRNKKVTESLIKWDGVSFIGITSRDYPIVESKLSDILDKNVDDRFYLSSNACKSILQRAIDSKKEIPLVLKNALVTQINNIKNIGVNEVKVFSLSSKGSNAMKSNNPNNGFSEVDVFRTIDTNGGNPICNQGGNVIVENNCMVRKLTPKECAKLQGFPVDWCDGLEEENTTDEKIKEWKKIIDDFNKMNKPNAKEKNEQQVKKWLENPYSDSAEYKLWGNGVALPCVNYIMDELVEFLNE